MKKKLVLNLIIFILLAPIYTKNINNGSKLINSDSWLMDAMYILCSSSKSVALTELTPISYEEYNFYLSKINYDSLDESSKKLYDKVKDYLANDKSLINISPLKFGLNMITFGQLMFKNNDNINWTFANPYSGNRYFDYNTDTYKSVLFIDESFAKTGDYLKPTFTFPISVNLADVFCFYMEPFLGKSIWGMQKDNNFTNVSYKMKDFDFFLPRQGYFSAGYVWNGNIGVNLQIGKEGYQMGRSLTGSVIYNNSFVTDGYAKLNVFTKNFKYETNIVQVGTHRYMYLHTFEIKMFERIRVGLMEGTFANSDFELRFLNPFMVMHSYGAWKQYSTELEEKYYSESHICQYFGFTLDIIPFKNSRLYFLYAQNEYQLPHEAKGNYGKTLPNGIGAQLGAEYFIPHNEGWWKINIEALYTSPYLYVKQGRDWSLISYRTNMMSNKNDPIYSWIGSPYGPDTLAIGGQVSYEKFNKLKLDFSYFFVAHGENNFSMFSATTEIDGQTYWAYYPSVLKLLGLISDEEATSIARDMSLTGVLQYTNEFKIHCDYYINNNLKLNGEVVYMFILNNNNIKTKLQHNLQLAVGVEYKLFN